MAALSVGCIRSTRPLAAELEVVVRDGWMPHILVIERNSCDSNCQPWSVVIVCVHPKRDINPDTRARVTVSAVMSGRGMASGECVKRCTALRQYLKTSDVGSGPTMSRCRCWNRVVGGVKSRSGVVVCLHPLDRWQAWHARAQVQHSFCTPGHTYRWEMSFAVALIIIIIIIIFIYCNWVVTRWQWLFYMYTKLEIGYY